MFEGKCPKCNQEIELSFNDGDEECPLCGYGGYWDEKYTDDNYWMVWYWNE